LEYLKHFTLACPCQSEALPEDAIALDSDPAFATVRFVDLPAPHNFAAAILTLPTTIAQLWQAIGATEIVHAGYAGYPIPLGWLVAPIVRLRRRFYLGIVESTPWRLQPRMSATIKDWLRAILFERMNRWAIANTDLAIFTQAEYRKQLMPQHPERGYVIHASWIDEANILTPIAAQQLWQQKCSPPVQELRILFAGRLLASKGVLILLAAMQQLSQSGIPVRLDILGAGELFSQCEQMCHRLSAPTTIQMLGTLPYGTEFFSTLQNYHALVVASLSDEQPRIVYDAYSQAVPVLASNTDGLRDCIQAGKTGKLVPVGDALALANLLEWSINHLDHLESMGMAALNVARGLTHQEMHRQRWQLLLDKLDYARS
jgi:glycosyltransferase involved in cell wall biosynthesis